MSGAPGVSRRRVLSGAAALAAAACRPPPVARNGPAPTSAALLQALRARQTSLRAAILGTRTTSWLDDKRLAADVFMIVERAGRLRFDAEVSLKGQVASLTTDGQRFTLLDHQARVLRQGPACAQNIASLIRIPLEAPEVAAILLGDAFVPVGAQAATEVGWDGALGADLLTVKIPGGGLRRISLRVRGGAAVDVVAVEGAADGAARPFRVRYEDLRGDAGVTRPRVIRFAEPGASFDDGVEIKVNDFEANPTLEPDAFALTAEGVREEWVPCGLEPSP